MKAISILVTLFIMFACSKERPKTRLNFDNPKTTSNPKPENEPDPISGNSGDGSKSNPEESEIGRTDPKDQFFSLPQQALTNALPSKSINKVIMLGSIVYAWSSAGLSYSRDGETWTTPTTQVGIEDALAFSKKKPYRALLDNSILELNEANGKWSKIADFESLNLKINDQIYFDQYNIYIASGKEIKIFQESSRKWTARGSVHGITGNNIELVYAEATKVYVQSDTGISYSENGGETFTLWKTNIPLSIEFDGRVLGLGRALATDKGVKFIGASEYLRTTENGLPSNEITTVFQIKGVTFAGTRNGLAKSTGNNGESWEVVIPNLEIRSIRSIETPTSTSLIVATSNGVATSVDGGSHFTFSTSTNEFEDLTVTCLEMSLGRLVASTISNIAGKNSSVFLSQDFGSNFSAPKNLHGNSKDLSEKHCVKSGRSFLYSASLYSFFRTKDLETWTAIPYPTTAGRLLIGLVPLPGKAIIFQNGNLYSLEDDSTSWTLIGKPNFQSATDLGNARLSGHFNENRLVFTSPSGLYISNGDDYLNYSLIGESTGLKFVNSSKSVKSYYFDGKNHLFITDSAFYISTDGLKSWSAHLVGNGLLKVTGKDDRIFISSLKGVYVSSDRGEHFTLRTTSDGIASNIIKDILFDSGSLYVGTDKGLSVLNPQVVVAH